MPTAEVTGKFEGLLQSIYSLLDTRKLADKLDGEIKLAEAQKAEREKKEGKRKEGEGEEAPAETEAAEGEVKAEQTEKERSVSVTRAGSVQAQAQAAHKRSASVLSQVSDKSSKRQKK
jgi:DNA methyltransferase 1-associated protein 1